MKLRDQSVTTRRWLYLAMLMTLLFAVVGTGSSAQASESESELAKKTQNPVADLISIPFQNNINFGIGPHNRMQNLLNVQPVIPMKLNSEWNLVTRSILPIIKQPNLATSSDSIWGIGDLNVTAFLSPANSGSVVWGAGPSVQFPTATDDATGTRKWTAGPSAAVAVLQGAWVFGGLVRQDWSFAGNDDRRSTSTGLIQPFLNYNLPGGWFLMTSSTITVDWEARGGNRWTVPVGGGFGKVQHIGGFPFSLTAQAYANVVRPDLAPDWTLRFAMAILLPKSMFSH